MSVEDILIQARAYLETSQPEKALEILSTQVESHVDDVKFLSLFGEVLLETNQLEQAYQVLIKACEMDSNCQFGVEKFLYLGQIIGGIDGINYINIGLETLNKKLNNLDNLEEGFTTKSQYKNWIIEKLNQGIFAQIEIWMTDLCMEQEAELKCNELIQISLNLDSSNAETWSLLSSIKISQQLTNEAIDALNKSWELFQIKKENLKQQPKDSDTFENSIAYIELIQPLLTLAKFAIELEQYDLSISITNSILDINESILDCYYIETLALLLKCKQIISATEKIDDYRDIPNSIVKESNDEKVIQYFDEIKLALTNGFKIINSNLVEEFDPEIVDYMNETLNLFGGPIMSELLPKKINDDDDENWENEINYEDN